MSLEKKDGWLELDAEVKRGCSKNRLLSICRGRPLPSQFRTTVWQHCLDLNELEDPFSNFDGLYNLPDQASIRSACHALVDKLGNEEEVEKMSVISDMESSMTLYCKANGLDYSVERGWTDMLGPLIAAKLSRADLYNVFSAIIEKFIARDSFNNKNQFHLFRLFLLYHDPELCTFLDTKKISPDLFASKWFSTLFASHCEIQVILNIWDIYFQLSDPFLIHFLALVIVVNARDQILCMETNCKEDIIDKLSSFPSALEAEDIEDFCSLAQYYISKTPKSYREIYYDLIFGTRPRNAEVKSSDDDERILRDALCLNVTMEEVINCMNIPKSSIEVEQGDPIKFFIVDCRPDKQFQMGHLISSYNLDAHLMLQNPREFTKKIRGLLSSHEQGTTEAEDSLVVNKNLFMGGGEHLCFIGGTDEEEDGGDDDDVEGGGSGGSGDSYMNMVVAHFLQKHAQYVAVCNRSFKAIHDAVKNNYSTYLASHHPKTCVYCSHGNTKRTDTIQEQQSNSHDPEAFLMEKFGKFSTAFKSTSSILKEKMITYIKNELPPSDTHVSSADKVGRRYRNMASVFTIGDDDEEDSNHHFSSEEEAKEMIHIDSWVKKYADPSSVYDCLEILHNSTTKPSLLCLNENHLVILRKVPDEPGKAWLQNKRSLSSILKITSKKRQPQFITIKYGAGGLVVPHPSTGQGKDKVISGVCQDGKRSEEAKQGNGKSEECADEERLKCNSNDSDVCHSPKVSVSMETSDMKEEGSIAKSDEKVVLVETNAKCGEKVVPVEMNSKCGENKVPQQQQQQISDGEVTVTAIDRFLITRAGEATKDIKTHIMKLVDLVDD